MNARRFASNKTYRCHDGDNSVKYFFYNSDEGELSSNGLFQVGVHNYQLVLNVFTRGFQGFDAYPLLKWAVILLCCNLMKFGAFLMAGGTPKWMVYNGKFS